MKTMRLMNLEKGKFIADMQQRILYKIDYYIKNIISTIINISGMRDNGLLFVYHFSKN